MTTVRVLLLAAALCGAVAAYNDARAGRQRATDVLTEKLFAVADMLTSLEAHVRKLDAWESGVTGLQARLDKLEDGQRTAATQLAALRGQVQNVSDTAGDTHAQLSSLATEQAGTTAALSSLQADLGQSLAGLTESVGGQSAARAAQHERTRAACSEGAARLSEPMAELRWAVNSTHMLAERTERALTGGLKDLGGRLKWTSQQVEGVADQLRQQQAALLATTTPPPTPDPQQAFLNSLYRSLSKRRKGNE